MLTQMSNKFIPPPYIIEAYEASGGMRAIIHCHL